MNQANQDIDAVNGPVQSHITSILIPYITACAALLGGALLLLNAMVFHQLNLPDGAKVSLDIALFVHQLHVIIILFLSLCYAVFYRLLHYRLPHSILRFIVYVQLLFLIGTACFSGTIYCKYLLAISLPGVLTVVGGALLIMTWIAFAWVLFILFRHLTQSSTS